LLDSGIVGETAPMVTIYGKPKDKGFTRHAKESVCKYTDACEEFLGGDMKALFMNTKKLSSVLNNFKPMIPEQFHAIWQNGIELLLPKTLWLWRRRLYLRFYRRLRALNFP
jgi:mevalonate kinase